MNKDMMLRIADAIEDENIDGFPIGFDMRTWGSSQRKHICGTVACVAGYASAIDVVDNTRSTDKKAAVLRRAYSDGEWGVFRRGMKLLDLSEAMADKLFLPDEMGMINCNVHLVPDALRWMALTGSIKWSEALDAAHCVRRKK